MTDPDSPGDGPQASDSRSSSTTAGTQSDPFSFVRRVAAFGFGLVVGMWMQAVILGIVFSAVDAEGVAAGVLYAVSCGIPGSWFLFLAVRRQRKAAEIGVAADAIDQAALLGLASTALVYGLCAAAISVAQR